VGILPKTTDIIKMLQGLIILIQIKLNFALKLNILVLMVTQNYINIIIVEISHGLQI